MGRAEQAGSCSDTSLCRHSASKAVPLFFASLCFKRVREPLGIFTRTRPARQQSKMNYVVDMVSSLPSPVIARGSTASRPRFTISLTYFENVRRATGVIPVF
jgi:hypothetical protein